jgi:phage recombination protein Bet
MALTYREDGGNSAQAALSTQHAPQYPREQLDLLKRTVADGKLSDDQFALFIGRAKATGLDPMGGQISAQARWNKRERRHDMSIITGIDGFRLIADRTGERDGEDETEWCGRDGQWVKLWTSNDVPFAARCKVYRKGHRRPYYGIAKLKAYKPTSGLWDGSWWIKAPDHMLAKCAEALALRKAFPAELSNMYTRDEMGQAVTHEVAEDYSDPRISDAPRLTDADRKAEAARVGVLLGALKRTKDRREWRAKYAKEARSFSDEAQQVLREAYAAAKQPEPSQPEQSQPSAPHIQQTTEADDMPTFVPNLPPDVPAAPESWGDSGQPDDGTDVFAPAECEPGEGDE